MTGITTADYRPIVTTSGNDDGAGASFLPYDTLLGSTDIIDGTTRPRAVSLIRGFKCKSFVPICSAQSSGNHTCTLVAVHRILRHGQLKATANEGDDAVYLSRKLASFTIATSASAAAVEAGGIDDSGTTYYYCDTIGAVTTTDYYDYMASLFNTSLVTMATNGAGTNAIEFGLRDCGNMWGLSVAIDDTTDDWNFLVNHTS